MMIVTSNIIQPLSFIMALHANFCTAKLRGARSVSHSPLGKLSNGHHSFSSSLNAIGMSMNRQSIFAQDFNSSWDNFAAQLLSQTEYDDPQPDSNSCKVAISMGCSTPDGATNCDSILPLYDFCTDNPTELTILYKEYSCTVDDDFFCAQERENMPSDSYIVATVGDEEIIFEGFVSVNETFSLSDNNNKRVPISQDVIVNVFVDQNQTKMIETLTIPFSSCLDGPLFLFGEVMGGFQVVGFKGSSSMGDDIVRSLFDYNVTFTYFVTNTAAITITSTLTLWSLRSLSSFGLLDLTPRVYSVSLAPGQSLAVNRTVHLDLTSHRVYTALTSAQVIQWPWTGSKCSVRDSTKFEAGFGF